MFDKYVSWSLRSMHVDLLVAFAWFGLDSFRVCKSKGITTIVERGSAHTLFREHILEEEYHRLGVKRLRKPLDPRIVERELLEYELADYIAVPSRFSERSFLDMGVPENKIVRIPYGVDLERFYPKPKNDSRSFKILSVGNLGIEKGTGYLVDSAELLKGLDLELVLVGSLDAYIRERLERCCVPWTFVGRVKQDQLPKWYNSATVYCLLSIQEGMSMTILEAMACGLPVVASVNTGAADIITDGVDGFLVPIRDPYAVAEKLLILYNNPALRREMGDRARERVSKLSWDNYGDSIEQEYRRLLQACRKR